LTFAYLYIRYSNAKQEKGDSLERQQQACRAFCISNGWSIADEFGDYGVSAWKGAHLTGGNLGKFAEQVRAGRIEPNAVLVVEALDRLSRQKPRETQRWLEDMTDLGLRIATVEGSRIYDSESLRSPGGILEVIEILLRAQMANEYVERLSSRISSSWANRRKEALAGTRKIVSGHLPGWLTTEGEGAERRPVEIPQRAQVVRQIYQWAAGGDGSRTIARKLNEARVEPWGRAFHHRNSHRTGWEHTYVGDILATSAVEGDYEPGVGRRRKREKTGERIVGYFPRVVDADLVQRARAAIAARSGKGGRGRDQAANLFSGFCICEHCGGGMSIVGNSRQPGRYLMCINASRGRGCEFRRLYPYKVFEAAAVEQVLHLVLSDQFFIREDESRLLDIELAETDRQIALLQGRIDTANGLVLHPDNAENMPSMVRLVVEMEGRMRELHTKRAQQVEALADARGRASSQEHLARVLEVRASLNAADYDERIAARRKVAQALIGVAARVGCSQYEGKKSMTLTLDALGLTKGDCRWTFDATGEIISEPTVETAVADSLRRQGIWLKA
jgi:DNA invertase Pin-like site-specific DNA recombinase